MFSEILTTFALSISPLGEARVGIPYGTLNGLHPFYAFLIGCTANLLVFPLLFKIIDVSDSYFWKYRHYKKASIYLSKRAKNKTQKNINKYGSWGLMVFVMIPTPLTGAYVGTIAAYALKMNYKSALFAVSLGVTISSTILATISYYFI